MQRLTAGGGPWFPTAGTALAFAHVEVLEDAGGNRDWLLQPQLGSTVGRGVQGPVRGRGPGVTGGVGVGSSHGCDGLIVEGDKGHAQRFLVHFLLLPPVVFLQPLLQLCVVLNGLHLQAAGPWLCSELGGTHSSGRLGSAQAP